RVPHISGPVLLPSPSSPVSLRPQAITLPVPPSSARLECSPAAIAATPVSPFTATGTPLFVSPPFPSSPNVSLPQDVTLPLSSSASPNALPAEMAVTFSLSPFTSTGTSLPLVVPLPSCPEPLVPHATTL